jgi:hypothetical protein
MLTVDPGIDDVDVHWSRRGVVILVTVDESLWVSADAGCLTDALEAPWRLEPENCLKKRSDKNNDVAY